MRIAQAVVAILALHLSACEPRAAPPALETARAPAGDAVVRVAGVSTGTRLASRLATAFETRSPGSPVLVEAPIGRPIEALADGLIDAALVITTGDVPPAPFALALARTRAVLAVGGGVGIRALAPGEWARTLYGTAGPWPGGLPRQVVLRPAEDPLQRALAEQHPVVAAALDRALAAGRWPVERRDGALLGALRRRVGSIAVTDTGNSRLTGSPVWTLDLGRPPPALTLWLVTAEHPPERLVHFVAFLRGSEARGLIADDGFEVP